MTTVPCTRAIDGGPYLQIQAPQRPPALLFRVPYIFFKKNIANIAKFSSIVGKQPDI